MVVDVGGCAYESSRDCSRGAAERDERHSCRCAGAGMITVPTREASSRPTGRTSIGRRWPSCNASGSSPGMRERGADRTWRLDPAGVVARPDRRRRLQMKRFIHVTEKLDGRARPLASPALPQSTQPSATMGRPRPPSRKNTNAWAHRAQELPTHPPPRSSLGTTHDHTCP